VKYATLRGSDVGACWRKARIAHGCRGTMWWNRTPHPAAHTPTIQPGETYLEYFECSHVYQTGDALCLACAIAGGFDAPKEAA